MASMLTDIWGRLAAVGCAPALAPVRWSGSDTVADRIRARHAVNAAMPFTYEVKHGFHGTTRRSTEGST
jgi:hypothetical protein